MNTVERHEMLMSVMSSISGQTFTVTSMRDMIVSQYPEESFNNADLRRWVYGKIKTLLKTGLITLACGDQGSKKSYTINRLLVEGLGEGLIPEQEASDSESSLSNKISIQFQQKATDYRLQLNVQLGEIEEYQRIVQAHPHLKASLSDKISRLTEENSRLLGRLKAVETLLNTEAG